MNTKETGKTLHLHGEIDIVVTWVDGKSLCHSGAEGAENCRFRDWGLMGHWFRCVQECLPWARRIHVVTNGQVPEGFDESDPKMRLVRHETFMPHDALPTFNSCAIEAYLDRIPDLAERFVYFNDDMFVLRPLEPEFFFKDGVPCDFALFDTIRFAPDSAGELVAQNVKWINANFTAREIYAKNRRRLLSFANGWKSAARNFLYMALVRDWVANFYNPHLPAALTKATYKEVWAKCADVLERTGKCRYREDWNVSHWLMRNWQLAAGNYRPRRFAGKYFDATDARIDEICDAVVHRREALICINDVGGLSDFAEGIRRIKDAFERMVRL